MAFPDAIGGAGLTLEVVEIGQQTQKSGAFAGRNTPYWINQIKKVR
jgi:hypothetical protein